MPCMCEALGSLPQETCPFRREAFYSCFLKNLNNFIVKEGRGFSHHQMDTQRFLKLLFLGQ